MSVGVYRLWIGHQHSKSGRRPALHLVVVLGYALRRRLSEPGCRIVAIDTIKDLHVVPGFGFPFSMLLLRLVSWRKRSLLDQKNYETSIGSMKHLRIVDVLRLFACVARSIHLLFRPILKVGSGNRVLLLYQ